METAVRKAAADHRVPRDVLSRYPGTAPRYTSYPSALAWEDGWDGRRAEAVIRSSLATLPRALSLYVHIPFCRSLCWYCGCNMMITRSRELVDQYVDAVIHEAERMATTLDQTLPVVQMHWGGGTPTHLNPEQLTRLYKGIQAVFPVPAAGEVSLEIHPPVTTQEQVETLVGLGFNRVSMGVQDFDQKVQDAVHRQQPFQQTRDLIQACRRAGFKSVNVDLMYGLPHQTPETFRRTLDQVGELRPDRLAVFGYAHVPSVKPHQKLLPEAALPDTDTRLRLFELTIERLTDMGYRYVGLDHFALPDNELAESLDARTLRRNFMGYTTSARTHVLALGASAISDVEFAYLQNAREVEEYLAASRRRELPVVKGMALSEEDRLRRSVINALFCAMEVEKAAIEQEHGVVFDRHFAGELEDLVPMQKDGLVELHPDRIRLTRRGQVLLRNVAQVFDSYARRPGGMKNLSRAI